MLTLRCPKLVSLILVSLTLLVLALPAQARMRMYSPELGTFMQRDPGSQPRGGMQVFAPRAGQGYQDGMSLYAGYFAMHAGIDPTGLTYTAEIKYSTSIAISALYNAFAVTLPSNKDIPDPAVNLTTSELEVIPSNEDNCCCVALKDPRSWQMDITVVTILPSDAVNKYVTQHFMDKYVKPHERRRREIAYYAYERFYAWGYNSSLSFLQGCGKTTEDAKKQLAKHMKTSLDRSSEQFAAYFLKEQLLVNDENAAIKSAFNNNSFIFKTSDAGDKLLDGVPGWKPHKVNLPPKWDQSKIKTDDSCNKMDVALGLTVPDTIVRWPK